MKLSEYINIRCMWCMVWTLLILAGLLATLVFLDALTDLLNKQYSILILARLMCGAWGMCLVALWLNGIYHTKPSPIEIIVEVEPSKSKAPAAPSAPKEKPKPAAAATTVPISSSRDEDGNPTF